MDAEHDFDHVLSDWERTLLQMETAVRASDWESACRLIEQNHDQFEQLREQLGQPGLLRSESRLRGMRQGVETLQRLTGLFEAWQRQFKTEIQHRRRALQTAKAYHPVSGPGPQHFRVYAGKPGGRATA